MNKKILLFLPVLLCGGCAQDDAVPAATSAADTGATQQVELPAADIDALLASADADLGKRIYIQCQACHTLPAGAPHKVGPNLAGLSGKAAAAAEGFTYSDALSASGITWDAASLDKWIERPSAFVPGTTMVFAGLPKAEDRANLIAYLLQATSQ